MSTVRTLRTGPVLGHTTSTGFRLWGRGGATPAVGVARIREHGAAGYGAVHAFAFVDHYDGVGIVDFGRLFAGDNADPLLPATRYEYQIGWVPADSIAQVEASADALLWPQPGNGDPCSGTTRTFPAEHDAGARTVFLSGSCRDPLPGGDQGESTFECIATHIDAADKPRCDFILMTGDQIYIDYKKPPADTPDGVSIGKYWSKYRQAWKLPWFAEVMRRLPAYMMMDDHEVQNNWSRGKFDADRPREPHERDFQPATLISGLRAYEAYQASVSPLIPAGRFRKDCFVEEGGSTPRYYYKFSHGQSDFFVLDVRSDSNVGNEGQAAAEILSTVQLDALEKWLVNGRSAVKFVVSPVPVFPDTHGPFGAPEDKWTGAALQRWKLLQYVWAHKNQIPRLVFLSGDVHVSFVAELKRKGDPDYRVYNVVSSAFNWVAPGLQDWNFAWGLLKGSPEPEHTYFSTRYSTEGIEGVHRANNYARITADRQSVVVEFFDGHRHNHRLERTELTFAVP